MATGLQKFGYASYLLTQIAGGVSKSILRTTYRKTREVFVVPVLYQIYRKKHTALPPILRSKETLQEEYTELIQTVAQISGDEIERLRSLHGKTEEPVNISPSEMENYMQMGKLELAARLVHEISTMKKDFKQKPSNKDPPNLEGFERFELFREKFVDDECYYSCIWNVIDTLNEDFEEIEDDNDDSWSPTVYNAKSSKGSSNLLFEIKNIRLRDLRFKDGTLKLKFRFWINQYEETEEGGSELKSRTIILQTLDFKEGKLLLGASATSASSLKLTAKV